MSSTSIHDSKQINLQIPESTQSTNIYENSAYTLYSKYKNIHAVNYPSGLLDVH